MFVVDFETEAIAPRPDYPPKPVGVAVLAEGKPPFYLAWGHPIGNNSSFEEAQEVLQEIWESDESLCFFNAKFDLEVALVHMGLEVPPWHRVHDAMFLAFLEDPHSASFALKPLAERYLNEPPTERDAVRDWLVEHDYVKRGAKNWGAFIARAPADLVGPYAIGDVTRTKGLFDELHPRNMGEAYDRERRLLPILLDNEREGIRVNMRKLRNDVEVYNAAQIAADERLFAILGREFNVNADRELAEALDLGGQVTQWEYTPTGQRSVAKDKLKEHQFKDPFVFHLLDYRQRLATALGTFLGPWLVMGDANEGRVHTNWNQIRSFGQGRDFAGARTGRLSSNPNFQNIPQIFENAPVNGLPPLPLMRSYFLPDRGECWACRDYSQQELRILAHFTEGALEAAYCADPKMDVHNFVQNEILRLRGIRLSRHQTKILNFGLIYGMGLAKLAQALGCSIDEARRVRDAHHEALAGLDELEQDIRRRGKTGMPIYTWGGRAYLAEPPKMVDGEMRSYEYKLLNYLIQGSAADCTKQAIINYDQARVAGRMLVTVHDEINISVPWNCLGPEMRVLKEAMLDVKFEVPMLSEGKSGISWGLMKGYIDAD